MLSGLLIVVLMLFSIVLLLVVWAVFVVVDCFVGSVANAFFFDCALVGFVGRFAGCSSVDHCLYSFVVCPVVCFVGCYSLLFIWLFC